MTENNEHEVMDEVTPQKKSALIQKLYFHNIKIDRPTVICRIKGIKRENNGEM